MNENQIQGRALVIDDNAVNRELATALLAVHHFHADEAIDGGAGLATLRRSRYDLVLLDISMPGLDGRKICKLIREDPELAGLYIVAYTAHAFPSQQQEMMDIGFDTLLIKPITMESMTKAIRPMLFTGH